MFGLVRMRRGVWKRDAAAWAAGGLEAVGRSGGADGLDVVSDSVLDLDGLSRGRGGDC